jgi:hypothetical protein
MCDSSSVSNGDTSCYSTDLVIISERYVVDHSIEGYEAPKDERPMDTYLKHYFMMKDESSTDYKNDGSSDLPKRVEKASMVPLHMNAVCLVTL